MRTLVDRYGELDLLERVKECLFKQFFIPPFVQFSGVLIHQLLLRKIKSPSILKFDIGEFTLITRLNFGAYLDKEVSHSTCLVSTYFNDSSIVRSYELKAGFFACNNKEDAWKLGLVYFVDGVLYSHKENAKVEMYLLSLVESREDFFKHPFGNELFAKTIIRVDKHMAHFQNLYRKTVEKRKQKKAGEKKIHSRSKLYSLWFRPIFTILGL